LATSQVESCTDHPVSHPTRVTIGLLTLLVTPQLCILLLQCGTPHITLGVDRAPPCGHADLARGEGGLKVVRFCGKTSWSNVVIQLDRVCKFYQCEVVINIMVGSQDGR